MNVNSQTLKVRYNGFNLTTDTLCFVQYDITMFSAAALEEQGISRKVYLNKAVLGKANRNAI